MIILLMRAGGIVYIMQDLRQRSLFGVRPINGESEYQLQEGKIRHNCNKYVGEFGESFTLTYHV